MTLLSIRWPLPKASVEYTWVRLRKVLRSALKSRGSPAQQMCGLVGGGGYQKGNSLNEKKRWNSFELSSVVGDTSRFLRSRCAPGGSLPSSPKPLVHALGCLLLCACSSTAVHWHFHASLFVSVSPFCAAWSSGQLPGNCGSRLSTQPGHRGANVHLFVVLIKITG